MVLDLFVELAMVNRYWHNIGSRLSHNQAGIAVRRVSSTFVFSDEVSIKTLLDLRFNLLHSVLRCWAGPMSYYQAFTLSLLFGVHLDKSIFDTDGGTVDRFYEGESNENQGQGSLVFLLLNMEVPPPYILLPVSPHSLQGQVIITSLLVTL